MLFRTPQFCQMGSVSCEASVIKAPDLDEEKMQVQSRGGGVRVGGRAQVHPHVPAAGAAGAPPEAADRPRGAGDLGEVGRRRRPLLAVPVPLLHPRLEG